MATKHNRTSKTAEKHLRRIRIPLLAKLILFLIVTAVLGTSLLFTSQIEHAFNFDAHLVDVEQTEADEINVIKEGELTVHFVDVGQGDCTIIELPDNKTMIIDGGEKDQKDKVLAYIEANLGEDFEVFDYCVLTHTDSDHCGSLDDVLNVYPARTVYRPNVQYAKLDYIDPAIALTLNADADDNLQFWANGKTSSKDVLEHIADKNTIAYKEFLKAAYDSPNEAKVGQTQVIVSDGRRDDSRPSGKDLTDIMDVGTGYAVKFFAPLGDVYGDGNNYSNILTISYNGRNIMLTGDAESAAEKAFVNTYANRAYQFDIDVMKLGHHGSSTSSSKEFLALVLRKNGDGYDSNYFVISCGLNNSYHHPHATTLTRLRESFGATNERILRTDTSGTILLGVNASGAEFNGVVAVAPTYLGRVKDSPVNWWHLALSIEVFMFGVIFCLLGTRKSTKKKCK